MPTLLNSAAAASAAPHASREAIPIRVLLIANASLGTKLKEKLLDQGFAAQVFDGAFLPEPSEVDADIVIIDQSLLGLSTIKAAALSQAINAPVVFINGRASLKTQAKYRSDVVRGSHAVDSLTSTLKLAATFVNSSKTVAAEEQLACGRLLLRRDTGRAVWNGVDLDLTFGEYRIVDLLASQPGHYFSYRAIYNRLWHEGFIAGEGTNGHCANVRTAIKRIRNKFRVLDPTFDRIKNYTGFGYCWRKPS